MFPTGEFDWSRDTARRFWEYEVTQVRHSFAAKHGRRIAGYVRRLLPKGGTVADLAAGPGFLTEALLRVECEVVAIERSISGRQLCEERNAAHPRYIGLSDFADAHALGPFDVAVGIEVIEHLMEDELADFLALLPALLKPGGHCVLTTPNAEDLEAKAVVCPSCGSRFHRWQHLRSIDAAEMRRCLVVGGLDVAAVFATDWSVAVPSWLRGHALTSSRRDSGPHLVGVGRRPR